ncbi:MAG: hypothetical protein IT563_19580 [Alphaproteobacteria bacterium]|nr:hypothetical protein [Alphaproteobacteria bacterium]
MQGTCKWFGGAAIGLIGLLGLFLSAHAHDATFYGLGLAIFVVAVLVIGAMVKRHFDLAEGAH